MDFGVIVETSANDILFLVITASVAALASLGVFLGCFFWFRREQRRFQRRILNTIARANREPGEIFISSRDAAAGGELVAQFKVNQGRQVVSVLEANGKRFIHIDGELTAPEREKMVRYLKSEGFMS